MSLVIIGITDEVLDAECVRLGVLDLLIGCHQVILLRNVSHSGAQMVQFRHDLPNHVESVLQMVFDWLFAVVLGSFLEHLILKLCLNAKLVSHDFRFLAALLQLGFLPLLLLTGVSADPLGSTMRVMAWLLSRRLVLMREAFLGRLNPCVGIELSG